MNGYYEQIVREIKDALERGEDEKAYRLAEEELSMPYVDPVYEKEFRALSETAREHITEKRSAVRVLDEKTVREYLGNGAELQMCAVSYLSGQNLRNWKEILQEYFLDPAADTLVRGMLIEAMKAQEIHDAYFILRDGKKRSFVPADVILPMESEALAYSFRCIHEWYSADEPTLVQFGSEVLAEEAYRRLPYLWNACESEEIAAGVMGYVLKISGREDEIPQFYRKIGQKHRNAERLFVEKTPEQSIINKS